MKWIIALEDVDKRLDLFLVEHGVDSSRSAIQKRIKKQDVLVNNKPATVHRFLKIGDVVECLDHQSIENRESRIENTDQIPDTRYPIPDTISIIAETADWIVINKPTGLLVHPHKTSNEPTLVDWLIAHDAAIAKVGEDPARPGIIHRLDREVSGLMVIAKTQAAYEHLGRQFRQRTIKKAYLAFAHGVIEKDEGEIKFRIARSATEPRMAARPSGEATGRAAWTHFRVLERFIGATLLELEIFSGRTHQIRAHLYALGHPVIGDTLYALKNPERNIKAPRLMLQSTHLTFVDPTSDLPQIFDLAPDTAFETLTQEFRVS